MLVCKKCGYQNREDNEYCVNCGEKIELTNEEIEARTTKKSTEKEQKALYLVFLFIIFAVIDIAVAYDFPLILISGLLIDAIIVAFLWFTWLGR